MRRRWLILALLAGCARQPPDALYANAEALRNQGKFREALEEINRGIAREPSWRFRILRAEVSLQNGDTDSADRALEAPPEPSNPEDRVWVLMLRGQSSFMRSGNDRADKLILEARDIARPLKSPRLEAELDMRQGVLRMRQHRDTEAEQLFRSMLDAAEQSGNLRLQASAKGNLGSIFAEMHRYDGAIFWLEQALSIFEQLGSQPDIGRAKGNLGWCYFQLGDEDRALSYLDEARQSAQAVGNVRDEQSWLGNLGNVYYDHENFQQAAAHFQQALKIARDANDKDWIRRWAESLASTLIELRQLDKAEGFNHEAEQADPGAAQYTAVNTARIEALRGRDTHAVELYRAILAHPSDDPIPVLNARSDLALLLAKMGRGPEAERAFRETLTQINDSQADLSKDDYRLSYLSNFIAFCDRYVDYLVNRGGKEPALEVAESVRARILNGRVTSAPAASATVAAIKRASASENTVFLSYWLAPKESFLWVIHGDEVNLFKLGPGRQIEDAVTRYRNYLEQLKDPLASENQAGKFLSETLLGPVRSYLKDGAKIIITPDRSLHALNFESLPDPNDPSHYLIDSVRLSVAPSLTLLAGQNRGIKPLKGSLLLIGDPESAGPDFPKLPNAQREIALVTQVFPKSRTKVLTKEDADAKAYLDSMPSQFSAIHFAAHATANPESPLDSALILSPTPYGYTLTARQVMNTPLTADLVTLSACHGAGAKTFSGEGLVGLSWAFLRAGAGSVVAGLWDVTDASTAALMGDFYQQMAAGVAPADALRAAKLKLVHSTGPYRKPFYWAPFQFYAGRL